MFLSCGGANRYHPGVMSRDLNCVECGACCVSPFAGEGYIQLSVEEAPLLRRLRLPVIEMTPDSGERLLFLGTRINGQGRRVCRALEGKVGRRVECNIYEGRPTLCRQFEAGSPECLQARRAVGIV